MTKNYIKLRKWSPLYQHYVYIDYADKSLADQIFIDNKISVKFKADYIKEGTPYTFVFCKVRRRDIKGFEQCLEALANVCDNGYTKFCDDWMRKCLW